MNALLAEAAIKDETNVTMQTEPKPLKSFLLNPIGQVLQVPPAQPGHHEVLGQAPVRNQICVLLPLLHNASAKLTEITKDMKLANKKLTTALPLLAKPPPWPWKQKQRPSSPTKCDVLDYTPKTHGQSCRDKCEGAN